MPYPITQAVQEIARRVVSNSSIVGSPSAATEVIVCQITGIDGNLPVIGGIWLSGSVSFTVGTSGAAIRVRIRQGTTAGSGTVVADTGAVTGGVSATNLISQDIQGFDTAATNGSVPASTSYHLSLQVTSGAAASTVSATNLVAIVA